MMGIDSGHAPALDLPARFMALSMVALAVSVLSAPFYLPELQSNISDFRLLAFVHINTLGVVGAMIVGASYQLVPVAIQTPLASVRAGRISFWFYTAGLALFLAGLWETWIPVLATGATLLGVAFVLYIGVILATWLRTPHRDVVSWHIVLGSLNAGAGMVFGVLLAFNKSNGLLGGRLMEFLAAHIAIMLGGWVVMTFFGVAYRLIGMFTLSEHHLMRPLAWTELAFLFAGIWLLALRFALRLPGLIGLAGGILCLAATACFAVQIAHLYQRRMRRALDVHMPFALIAAVFAIVATLLLAFGLATDRPPSSPVWVASVWLALFGVAETAIQGFFYKIATFLVWLKRYAPVAGTRPVPQLDQLYDRRLAFWGWGAWSIGVIGVALSLLLDLAAIRLIALLLLAGAGCFLVNVVSIARHWKGGRRPVPNRLVIRRAPS